MAENLKISSTPLVNVPSALKIDRLGLVSALDWTIAGTLALLVGDEGADVGLPQRVHEVKIEGASAAEVFVSQE